MNFFTKGNRRKKRNTQKNENKNIHTMTLRETENISKPLETIDELEKQVDYLETLLKSETTLGYDSQCIRKKSNWSISKNVYNFDHPNFSPETLLNDIPSHSPKLDALLQQIKKQDETDMKNHGKLFKHFIYSDVKGGYYGSKLLASALIANGFSLGYAAKLKDLYKHTEEDDNEGTDEDNKKQKRYEKIEFKSKDELTMSAFRNFYLLTSGSVYEQSITVNMKKQILTTFNKRPDNTHGEDARIIIMDSGFKEGIDLFDIKYVHIFEPSITPADQKQVIGRATRLCGQKGLEFHPLYGWELEVFIYDLEMPELINNAFMNANSGIELYLKSMNMDVRKFNFNKDIEKASIFGAIDKEITKNIHPFLEEINIPEPKKMIIEPNNDVLELIPKNRVEYLNYHSVKQQIMYSYSQYYWDFIKVENKCVDDVKQNTNSQSIVEYSPSQTFVKEYFTPDNLSKGLLLWWSVGSGKTCGAIATASDSFEKQGYTILWVTKTTLKDDIWKNMFDQICYKKLRYEIENNDLKMPENKKDRMKLLSNSWKIRPMSYRQFSNLVSKKNAIYKQLVKINGETDPLNKTLIIIDEAHKLYGGGLSAIEQPNMDAFHTALMNSYELSGNKSARLLLMSATPIASDPLELIKLLNLCRNPYEQMPVYFDDFSKIYLKNDGFFSKNGVEKYLNDIAGHISYLNREHDIRQFSQPNIHEIKVPLIHDGKLAKKFDKKVVRDLLDTDVVTLQNKLITENVELDKSELGDLDPNKFMYLKDEKCKEYVDKDKKDCEKIVKKNIRDLVKHAKEEVKIIKNKLKDIRNEINTKKLIKSSAMKEIKSNILTYVDDYDEYKKTQLYAFKNECATKVTSHIGLTEAIKEHPTIMKYDKQIEEQEAKIQTLYNDLKRDSTNYKIKLQEIRSMLNQDYSPFEKNALKSILKQQRKAFNKILKDTRKENIIIEKDASTKINNLQKTRNKRINKLRKSIRTRISNEKRDVKDLKRSEKELIKSIRKQEGYKEEIDHELLKRLIGKYSDNIDTELDDLFIMKQQKEKEKQQEREEKQALREKKKEMKKQQLETRKQEREKSKNKTRKNKST